MDNCRINTFMFIQIYILSPTFKRQKKAANKIRSPFAIYKETKIKV
jgi:hypothetical protein